jgi:hypothetical protein
MNERICELAEEAGFGIRQNEIYTAKLEHLPITENMEKFAELILADYAVQLVQANMSNHWYVQAMDEHYEQKWAHRFG